MYLLYLNKGCTGKCTGKVLFFGHVLENVLEFFNISKCIFHYLSAIFVSLSCLNMCQKYDLRALEKVQNSKFQPASQTPQLFAHSFSSFVRFASCRSACDTGKCTGNVLENQKKCTGKCTGMYLNFTFFIWRPPCCPTDDTNKPTN